MPDQKKELANLHLALIILFILSVAFSKVSAIVNFGTGIGMLVISLLILVRGKGVKYNRVPNIIFLIATLMGSVSINLLVYVVPESIGFYALAIIIIASGLTGFISIFLLRKVYIELKQSAKEDLFLTNEEEKSE